MVVANVGRLTLSMAPTLEMWADRLGPSLGAGTLDRFALDKLHTSCLTIEDAKSLGIEFLNAKQTRELTTRFEYAALKIPYHNLKGSLRPDIWRVRLFPPLGAYGEKSKLRYTQSQDTPPAAYFPCLIDWEDMAKDTNKPIIFTEGEFKAACATRHGLPCIGLGGVFSFQSKGYGFTFLPELEAIRWTGRMVTICFDSDASTNPMIGLAIHKLTNELRKRGAMTSIAIIPPILNGSGKTGLDDYIFVKGVDEFKVVLNAATPDNLSPELWGLNGRAAIVRTGMVIDELSSITYSFGNFQVVFGNQWAEKQMPNGTTKKVSISKEWIEWPQRQTVDALTYIPGAERLVDGKLNIYRPSGVVAKKGDITPWTKLLKHLFTGTEISNREWFERWCGYPFHNPGVKLISAVGIWSHGTGQGKTKIGETLGKLYGENAALITQQQLESTFNSWCVNKQFILVDEMTANDSRAKAAVLKSLITGTELLVSKKYVPEYPVPNHAVFYLTSNDSNAFYMDDNDRRYFIHEVTVPPLSPEFYIEYQEWMDSPEGQGALLWHFQNMNYGDFDPKARPPMTTAKMEMILSVKGELGHWCQELKENPDTVLRIDKMKFSRDLWTAQELVPLFNHYAQGRAVSVDTMGRHLGAAGFKRTKEQLRINGERARYFIIRGDWADKKPDEMKKHIEEGRKKDGVKV